MCTCIFVPAYAEDSDESEVVKAVDAIIEGLPGALKAGVDFSKMSSDQKVDWVLTSVETKV